MATYYSASLACYTKFSKRKTIIKAFFSTFCLDMNVGLTDVILQFELDFYDKARLVQVILRVLA